MKVIVYNNESRIIGLPNQVMLYPGENEIDSQLLADVRHVQVVEYLFSCGSLRVKEDVNSTKKKVKKKKAN